MAGEWITTRYVVSGSERKDSPMPVDEFTLELGLVEMGGVADIFVPQETP